MSYILEALKKSQQERELGRVPTLDATGLFAEDKEPEPANHWALLAVGLASLAVVIALYAAFREVPRSAVPVVSAPDPQPLELAVAPNSTASPGTERARGPLPEAVVAPLAEPPPPKPATGSVNRAAPAPVAGASPRRSPAADVEETLELEWEQELLRQLEAEQAAINASREVLDERPQTTPVPPDLVQDIEAFKQQVRREQGIPPPESKRAPARITGDPTRLKLTPQQQAMVPGYLMTVHVYDADADKRFVVINALRYREGDETREGLRVERILKDGAVLSYLGNPFYVPR